MFMALTTFEVFAGDAWVERIQLVPRVRALGEIYVLIEVGLEIVSLIILGAGAIGHGVITPPGEGRRRLIAGCLPRM